MRTIWNGSISFGLVNIPVGLAPATKPAARQSDIAFRTLHRECGTPIKQKRWCPTHEREVDADEIVKGWEVAKGQFVIVEDADLEAIAQHDNSRAIEITRFVELDEVDPIFFDRTYFLAPAGEPAARRPYALLLKAMRAAKLAGQELAAPEPVVETPVVDLMEALKRSVVETKGRKRTPARASSDGKKSVTPKRRAAARK